MQVNGTIPIVTAPVQTDIATTITALIVAIGGMLAAVATIMQRLGDRKELSKHSDALHFASKYLDDVGQHLISSKEDIKSLAEITYSMSPEKAKEIVNQQNVRLAELTKKLEDAQAKLSKVPDVIQRI